MQGNTACRLTRCLDHGFNPFAVVNVGFTEAPNRNRLIPQFAKMAHHEIKLLGGLAVSYRHLLHPFG